MICGKGHDAKCYRKCISEQVHQHGMKVDPYEKFKLAKSRQFLKDPITKPSFSSRNGRLQSLPFLAVMKEAPWTCRKHDCAEKNGQEKDSEHKMSHSLGRGTCFPALNSLQPRIQSHSIVEAAEGRMGVSEGIGG